MSNKKIGEKLREIINIKYKIKQEDCWLCSGLTGKINTFVLMILKSLKNYEFDTFLLGNIIEEDILRRENILLDNYKLKFFESIKNELNREIGKILEKKLLREVDFINPTIMIIIDTQFYIIYLQIKSLYIYGRYNKYTTFT